MLERDPLDDDELPGTSSAPRLATLLAARIDRDPPSSADRARFLDAARTVVERRVAAIAEVKARGAYERVARIAVACAEGMSALRGVDAARGFLDSLEARYPRHTALRGELQRALTRSEPLGGLARPRRA